MINCRAKSTSIFLKSSSSVWCQNNYFTARVRASRYLTLFDIMTPKLGCHRRWVVMRRQPTGKHQKTDVCVILQLQNETNTTVPWAKWNLGSKAKTPVSNHNMAWALFFYWSHVWSERHLWDLGKSPPEDCYYKNSSNGSQVWPLIMLLKKCLTSSWCLRSPTCLTQRHIMTSKRESQTTHPPTWHRVWKKKLYQTLELCRYYE